MARKLNVAELEADEPVLEPEEEDEFEIGFESGDEGEEEVISAGEIRKEEELDADTRKVCSLLKRYFALKRVGYEVTAENVREDVKLLLRAHCEDSDEFGALIWHGVPFPLQGSLKDLLYRYAYSSVVEEYVAHSIVNGKPVTNAGRLIAGRTKEEQAAWEQKKITGQSKKLRGLAPAITLEDRLRNMITTIVSDYDRREAHYKKALIILLEENNV